MSKRKKGVIAKTEQSVLGGRRQVLVRPETFFEDLKTLVSRHDGASSLFEREFWRLLEFDASPDAVGWVESELTADYLRENLGIDFAAFCEMFDDDIEAYIKTRLKDDPDEYLSAVDCNKTTDFVVFALSKLARRTNQLTESELWEIVKDRFADEIADAVRSAAQKELNDNLEYYLPLE